ncbi:hypothetical protein ABT297_14420 [Dactylosporangium sp. NPDC000555]|uniref:hypothetical protein n=1 Tax=Dactylosporangium sp. NPDC000555 TaxID=3154260 RepID=UPI003329442D
MSITPVTRAAPTVPTTTAGPPTSRDNDQERLVQERLQQQRLDDQRRAQQQDQQRIQQQRTVEDRLRRRAEDARANVDAVQQPRPQSSGLFTGRLDVYL